MQCWISRIRVAESSRVAMHGDGWRGNAWRCFSVQRPGQQRTNGSSWGKTVVPDVLSPFSKFIWREVHLRLKHANGWKSQNPHRSLPKPKSSRHAGRIFRRLLIAHPAFLSISWTFYQGCSFMWCSLLCCAILLRISMDLVKVIRVSHVRCVENATQVPVFPFPTWQCSCHMPVQDSISFSPLVVSVFEMNANALLEAIVGQS